MSIVISYADTLVQLPASLSLLGSSDSAHEVRCGGIVGGKIHMVTLVYWNIDEIKEKGVSSLGIGRTGNQLRIANWGGHLGGFLA